MSKIVARNCKILFGGYDLSGNFNNSKLTQSGEAPEVTCYGSTVKERLADGLRDRELTVDGYFNTSPSSVDVVLAGLEGASALMSYLPEGWAASTVAHYWVGVLTKYDQTYATANAAAVSLTFSGSVMGGRGKCLGYISNSAGSTTGCSIDFGGSSQATNVVLHVLGGTATSISASLTGASVDNSASYSTYADLGAFTSYGVSASLATGSLPRYRQLRYAFVGGTGQIVAVCGQV